MNREWSVVSPAAPAWGEGIEELLLEHAEDLVWTDAEKFSRASEVAASAISHRLSAVAWSRVLEAGQEMKVVGVAVIERQRRGHVGALRLLVHRDWRRRGIARELLREVLMQADARGIHRVEATPYRREGWAGKVILFEEFGFEEEGTMRKAAVVNNEFVNVTMMARVR